MLTSMRDGLRLIDDTFNAAENAFLKTAPGPHKPIARYQITAHGDMRCSGILRIPFTAQYVAAVVSLGIPPAFLQREPLTAKIVALSPEWDWVEDEYAVPTIPEDVKLDDVLRARIARFWKQKGK